MATAAPGSVGTAVRPAGSEPRAAASRIGPSAVARRGRIACVSGSPKRALHSSRIGPVGGQHEPGVQRATERGPASGQLGQDRPVDRLEQGHGLVVGQVRDRAVGAHPAGIRAGVAVAEPLVVARDGQGDRLATVAQGDEADLATDRAAPRRPRSRRRRRTSARIASVAVARSSQTVTPLPAASPSAFTTQPSPAAQSSAANAIAVAASVNVPARAIRTPAALAISWQNALLDSIRAAAADGPKTANPASRSASATPAASGASGPTTTSSAAQARATATTAAPSSGSTGDAADPRLLARCRHSPVPRSPRSRPVRRRASRRGRARDRRRPR